VVARGGSGAYPLGCVRLLREQRELLNQKGVERDQRAIGFADRVSARARARLIVDMSAGREVHALRLIEI
jgi:hypothetical protein